MVVELESFILARGGLMLCCCHGTRRLSRSISIAASSTGDVGLLVDCVVGVIYGGWGSRLVGAGSMVGDCS